MIKIQYRVMLLFLLFLAAAAANHQMGKCVRDKRWKGERK